MAELGNAYVNIIPKAPGIEANIETLLGGGSAGGAAAKAGESLGKQLLGGLTKLGIGAAAGKLIRDALDAGGKVQQSFGGLDTIYGDAAAGAKKYATEAAKAGISMNSYAEQAVSFGAALRQAYGGDLNAAMEAANLAILDMADNSAKMGTDLGSIQAAYQGFAKQNYTMLDNLKLGYGGTKTEMERLLDDAQKLTGVKYDINNLGDVYAAIHAVQEALGLTGVAAEEAKTTLTGSAQAMKASWENFLAALTTGEGMDAALENLGSSVRNYASNLLAMLGSLFATLPDVLTENLNKLSDTIVASFDDPDAYDEAADKIIAGLGVVLVKGGQLGWALAKAVILGLAAGINGLFTVVDKIGKAAGEQVGEWYDAGAAYVQNLISGAATKVENLKIAAGALIDLAKTAITDKFTEIVTAGEELVTSIKTGIENKVSEVLTAISTMITDIWNSIINFDWSALGAAIVEGIKSGISSMASSVSSAAASVRDNLVGGFKSLFKINSPSKLMADEIGSAIPEGIALGISRDSAPLDASVADLGRGMVNDLRRYTAPGMLRQNDAALGLDGLAARINDRPVSVTVTLEGETRQLFRVVRRDSEQFARETGASAFAGGYA